MILPGFISDAGHVRRVRRQAPALRRAPSGPRTSRERSSRRSSTTAAELDVAPLPLRARRRIAAPRPGAAGDASSASSAATHDRGAVREGRGRRAPARSALVAPASTLPRRPASPSRGSCVISRRLVVARDGADRRRGPRRPASGRRRRRAAWPDAHDDLVGVDLLERDVGSPRTGVVIASSSSAWTSLGLTSGRRRARRSTEAGSRSGTTAAREHDVVGHHDGVLALGERRVEQPERGDDALDLAGQAARLQPHAVADLERARADQDDAGDHVAERLLGGETDDHRGDGATAGQRARGSAPRRAARAAPRPR